MTDIHLPAQSYEEAIPYLRAPYLPSQVQARVLTAPENPAIPCTIALYAIGETLMDRFTLVCGGEWEDPEFITLGEKQTGSGDRTSWYCKLQATFVAFGVARTDIGEGTASTQAGAEMNARAQAGKRAGRKHGPGQCLYACETIVMFRGDKPDQLRLPKGEDPKRYLRPYFDKEGQGQAYCRDHYARWLANTGEKVYGPPLDHLAIAQAIRSRPSPGGPADGARARPSARGEALQSSNGADGGHDDLRQSTEARLDTSREAREYLAMPDRPAPEALVKIAREAGFDERVTGLLSNLVRGEGQDSDLSDAQQQTVANWITAIRELDVAAEVVTKAIEFNASRNTSQERRQARFVKWLAEKAAGETEPEAQGQDADRQGQDADRDAPGARDDGESAPNGNGALEAARALVALRKAKEDHEYSDRTVTRLAALATGVGPKARVEWQKLTSATLLTLAELLGSAASLGWKNDQLDREVVRYHNSSEQTSSAGRFAAFANYLTDLAETRAMTEADPIGVG